MPPLEPFRAFIDESSAARGDELQEYMIAAVLIPADRCDAVREALRPLLLPGQIKLHWTDESESRRRVIIQRLCELETVNVVVTHVSRRQRKTERFRRKCLEDLYYEMVGMKIYDLTLESRGRHQDSSDRGHIVALQGQGLEQRVRIKHLRGGDEPLLWIADAILGAINSTHLGIEEHLEALSSTFLIHKSTGESLLS
ncbi:hypothetical protein ACSS7Z_15055 [Microbacterium sp. A82]|uniref:hypothetical protein n=1 Tax=unclassified Microbacterium TaxID=2609290 RepID=UPI003F3C9CE7